MEKRFRNITIDDQDYTWSIRSDLDGDGGIFLKIWEIQDKGKNLIFDDNICVFRSDENEILENVTPKKIKEFINELKRDRQVNLFKVERRLKLEQIEKNK